MFAIGNRALRKDSIGVAWWCETCGIGKLGDEQLVGQFFVRAVRQRWKVACQRYIFAGDILAPILFSYYLKKQCPREAASSVDSNVDGTIRDKLVNLDHRGIGLWLEYVGAIVWGEISSHGSWDYNQCMELWSLSTCSLGDHLTCWMITWNHKSPPGTTGNHLGPPSQLEGALGRWMWSSWAGGWWPVRTFNDADCALIELAQLVHTRNWWSYLGDPM